MHPSLIAMLSAVCLAVATANAAAGRLDPVLDAKLRNAAPGEQMAVIVEMKEQAPPAAVLAGMPKASRKARLRALVSGLRERAQHGQSALKAELAQQHALGNLRRMRAFWIFNGFALTADPALIRRLAAREDVREVRIDALIPSPPVPASAQPASTDVEWNITQVRAPEVWALDPAYNGSAVVVGSFDTGVHLAHPDLFARYRGDDAISWFDPYGEHSFPFDFHGHGTHTTGTAVGGNDAGGAAIGVAPGAKWIAAKAWADDGTGLASAFHQIFEWFLAPGGNPDNAPDVVINSWSLNLPGCITEFAPDIQAWRAAGIFPAFAAGNSGPGSGSVRSPGAYPEAFAVGATDMFDEIAAFSSRGPSPCSGAAKPDLSAPGAGVRSSVPGGYGTLSGTSMATPHVAGAVAVLRSINPALTIDELSDLLKLGATDVANPGPDNDSGAGRMDLYVSAQIAIRGLNTPLVKVIATQPTATEAGPTAGTLTLTRTGSTEAELQVRLEVTGTATAGSDYVPLPGAVTIPAGAASVALPVLAIDDALQELNETVVVTIVPDPAYIALGSRVAAVLIVSDELFPDLAASALSAPASAGAGQSITLTETTRNQGGGAAGGSATRYYLSGNATFDAGDTELASRAVPPLAPGAASSASIPVTIPAGTAPATWYLIAAADAEGAVLESAETNNAVSRSIQIGPDLTVSALSAPAVSGAGESLVASATTANQGGGPAGASQTRYFLSANTVLDAADVPLGSSDVAALPPGAVAVDAATLVIPAATATGTWYLVASADATNLVPETTETNNTRNRSIRIGPDLAVSALTAAASAGAGQSLSLTDTTANSGGGAAVASATTIYLSSNTSWDAADLPLGTREVPPLAAAASSSGSFAVTLPDDLASGNWYLLAKADADSAVAETLESNNVFLRGIKIGPDLRVTGFSAPTTAGPGDSITVSESTTNDGGGAAAASVTQYFLSATSTLDAAAVPLGSHAVPALQPGAASPAATSVSIPPETAAGTWYLVAQADAGAAVSELLETNNVANRSIRIGPDLTVSTLSAPSDAGAGQAVTITDTTKNSGGGTADPSITRLYLSADLTLDAADTLIGTRSVAALTAGASNSAPTPVTIPPETATGTWQILAVADATELVAETFETNNVYRRAIDIGPDLTVSALTAPATAGAGQTLNISDTTRNQGGGAVEASSTAYFLSGDSKLDGGDVQLAIRTVPALGAGANSSATIAVTIPADTATGSWYVLAVADTAGLLVETSESNNLAGRLLWIGGDLSVSALTVPAVAAAGHGLTVTDVTKNVGGAPVAASQTYFFLSADTILQTSDTPLASRNVPALTAGASSSGSVQLTIPADTATGRWYVLAVADGSGSIEESIETNNLASRPLSVGPDLTIATLSAPTSGVAGQQATVSVTTRNLGGDDAPPSLTQLFLSTNSTLDQADIALGERAIPALAAGASSAASIQVLIPADTAAGRWYLLARADALNEVGETVETNNVASRSITISVP